uniref:Uncharacterized protein n=1 Tax=Vespula pensylvanica TaxID=30213 RepID=A0A834KH89_VESPE|nr:hypothetical protein H0235_014271 [Vespula pensylvanica]
MSERKGVNGLQMVPSDGHVRAVGTERYAEGSPARHICYYRRWGRLAGGVSECGATIATIPMLMVVKLVKVNTTSAIAAAAAAAAAAAIAASCGGVVAVVVV